MQSSWLAANILTILVFFYALSIGGGPVAAALLCMKRESVEVEYVFRKINTSDTAKYHHYHIRYYRM